MGGGNKRLGRWREGWSAMLPEVSGTSFIRERMLAYAKTFIADEGRA